MLEEEEGWEEDRGKSYDISRIDRQATYEIFADGLVCFNSELEVEESAIIRDSRVHEDIKYIWFLNAIRRIYFGWHTLEGIKKAEWLSIESIPAAADIKVFFSLSCQSKKSTSLSAWSNLAQALNQLGSLIRKAISVWVLYSGNTKFLPEMWTVPSNF